MRKLLSQRMPMLKAKQKLLVGYNAIPKKDISVGKGFVGEGW